MTSHLDTYLTRTRFGQAKFTQADYEAAILADWRQGRPEQVKDDGDGMGFIASADGLTGYVGTKKGAEPVTDFRSVSIGRTRRSVFAVDPAGRAYYVGDIWKHRAFSRRHPLRAMMA